MRFTSLAPRDCKTKTFTSLSELPKYETVQERSLQRKVGGSGGVFSLRFAGQFTKKLCSCNLFSACRVFVKLVPAGLQTSSLSGKRETPTRFFFSLFSLAAWL